MFPNATTAICAISAVLAHLACHMSQPRLTSRACLLSEWAQPTCLPLDHMFCSYEHCWDQGWWLWLPGLPPLPCPSVPYLSTCSLASRMIRMTHHFFLAVSCLGVLEFLLSFLPDCIQLVHFLVGVSCPVPWVQEQTPAPLTALRFCLSGWLWQACLLTLHPLLKKDNQRH